jgi:hypothetical protein
MPSIELGEQLPNAATPTTRARTWRVRTTSSMLPELAPKPRRNGAFPSEAELSYAGDKVTAICAAPPHRWTRTF